VPTQTTTIPVQADATAAGLCQRAQSDALAGAPAFTGVLAWVLSPRALRAGAAAMLNGHAAALTAAELRWHVRVDAGGTGSARAELALTYRDAGPERRVLFDGPADVGLDARTGLVHVEVGQRLRAVLAGPAGTVLYAATSVWHELGLTGGTYGVPALVPADPAQR
jgi:hypothetical protein